MKRPRLPILLAFLLLAAVCAMPAGIDLVVMVDTSASMFPVFDDLVNYLLRDILENRLREGDSFHLLSFDSTAERELAEKIEEGSDLAAVIGRVLLLKPLGRYTDLIGALEWLYSYLDALPQENRKLVLILTDGIHDPPPGSANRVGAQEALQRLLANTERIRREGWEVRILKTPGREAGLAGPAEPGTPQGEAGAGQAQAATPQPQAGAAGTAGDAAQVAGDGAPTATEPQAATAPQGPAPGEAAAGDNFLQELAEAFATDVVEMDEGAGVDTDILSGKLTGFATLRFPGDLGTVSRRVRVPFLVSNFSDQVLDLTLASVLYEGRDLLARGVRARIAPQESGKLEALLRLPSDLPPGEHRLPVALLFADPEVRVSPLQGELLLRYDPSAASGSKLASFLSAHWLYLLIALLAAAAVVFLVLFLRNRMAEASFAGFYGAKGRGRKKGRPIIMRVQEQNSQIGSRNIHRLPPKASLSVGGDGSAFLIYFVQVPRRIGVLKNDGKQLVFIPIKAEHFVDLTGPLLDCLEKPIRAVSVRGYPIVFSFHEYVSPLEEINRLMRSIHHEGAYPPKAAPKAT